MDKFSEMKSAALAATPGPWILDDDSWSDGDNANVSTEERYDGSIVSIAQIEGGGSESGFDEPFSAEQQANARYITAANPAVVLALLAELEAKDKRISELEDDKRQLNEIVNSEANRASAAEKRITEMEFNELNLIAERDNAENVVTNMYRAATGDSPEWSNWFGFADAIEEVAQTRAKLEASKKSNTFLKERLSQLANFNPDWDILEACRESWREVSAALKEAEDKLATPVRLPNKNDDEFWFGSTFQVAKFDRAVERAISAAGFKFVGDE